MKAIQHSVLLFLLFVCAGCVHSRKIAGLYVPFRCIEKVSWSKPCATVSEHLVKCDGVMVTTKCVAARSGQGNQLEQGLAGR